MSQSNADIKHAAYSAGHDAAVLRTHAWRTVDNSAPHLKGLLKPDMNVLDVGCGPGSITVDLARCVPAGHVTGVENVPAPLAAARAHAAQHGATNVSFAVGDALALPFPDASFDVAHAHQVLQHTGDPVRALREMRRVVRPGGLVACRESDHAAFVWFPPSAGLDAWSTLSVRVARADGREPDAGRRLHVWAREAGFDPAGITTSAGTWCFHTREEREYWGGAMGSRVARGSFAESAISKGFATQDELDQIAQAWRDWVNDDDGWFAVLHGQMICRV